MTTEPVYVIMFKEFDTKLRPELSRIFPKHKCSVLPLHNPN